MGPFWNERRVSAGLLSAGSRLVPVRLPALIHGKMTGANGRRKRAVLPPA